MPLPNTAITTTIVGNELGVSDRQVGVLCTSDKINMWSKYKPVVYQGFPDRASEWWRATDGNCGFIAKQIASYESLPENMDGDMNGWIREFPAGGQHSPYRLFDFAKYNHTARPFISQFQAPERIDQNTSSISIACMIQTGPLPFEIAVEDIQLFRNYYFGAYIKQKNGNESMRATSTMTLGSGSASIVFNTLNMTVGEWTIYPFIAENIIDQNMPDSANVFYTIANLQAKTMMVIRSFIKVQVFAELQGLRTLKWRIEVSSDSSDRTFTNNNLAIRYGNRAFTDPYINGEKLIRLGDITVPANDKVVLDGSEYVDADLVDSPYGIRVWASLQSATYLESTLVMTSQP